MEGCNERKLEPEVYRGLGESSELSLTIGKDSRIQSLRPGLEMPTGWHPPSLVPGHSSASLFHYWCPVSNST